MKKSLEVVGHKTLRDEAGNLYHEPLYADEAAELWRHVEAEQARREALMPDEEAARKLFFDAWLRLKDFGWNDAIYCPKDGSMFQVIEAGSTGTFPCNYHGEWPKGSWWAYCDGDVYPSRPTLFKPLEK